MAGGSDEDVARARPLLEAMGELIVHVGALGQGQTVKLINNAVAAVNCATIAQALLVGTARGRRPRGARRGDGRRLGRARRCSRSRPARCATHDYTTLFKLEHMLKDVGLCLEEARAAGAPFPSPRRRARALRRAASAAASATQDFAAVLEVLEGLAGTKV